MTAVEAGSLSRNNAGSGQTESMDPGAPGYTGSGDADGTAQDGKTAGTADHSRSFSAKKEAGKERSDAETEQGTGNLAAVERNTDVSDFVDTFTAGKFAVERTAPAYNEPVFRNGGELSLARTVAGKSVRIPRHMLGESDFIVSIEGGTTGPLRSRNGGSSPVSPAVMIRVRTLPWRYLAVGLEGGYAQYTRDRFVYRLVGGTGTETGLYEGKYEAQEEMLPTGAISASWIINPDDLLVFQASASAGMTFGGTNAPVAILGIESGYKLNPWVTAGIGAYWRVARLAAESPADMPSLPGRPLGIVSTNSNTGTSQHLDVRLGLGFLLR